jgi:hypothetical protein
LRLPLPAPAEQTYDGDHAAKIIQNALGIESDGVSELHLGGSRIDVSPSE